MFRRVIIIYRLCCRQKREKALREKKDAIITKMALEQKKKMAEVYDDIMQHVVLWVVWKNVPVKVDQMQRYISGLWASHASLLHYTIYSCPPAVTGAFYVEIQTILRHFHTSRTSMLILLILSLHFDLSKTMRLCIYERLFIYCLSSYIQNCTILYVNSNLLGKTETRLHESLQWWRFCGYWRTHK